ncbi:hypothetical protein ACKWTF_003796 [Chironomus riparius]
MKTLIIFLFVVKISTLLANEVEFFNTTCFGSEIIKVNYCESSKDTFWVEIFINKPLNTFFFQYEIYRKTGKKYTRYGATPPIDWCKFNAGNLKILSFQKILINTFLKPAKMLFHPCPFQGKHTFFNVTPPKQVYDVFQPGTRRFLMLAFDSENTTMFSLTTHLKISRE